ncbi:hypothetical protein HN51_065082 [Arachis hypogaea]
MATAAPPRRRCGSLLHGDGAVLSSTRASPGRRRDACRTVATSVPLASFDATRRLPLCWSIALATRRPPLNLGFKLKGKEQERRNEKEPLEHTACLNFDCECFNGVLNLLRYSNVFELNIGSELRCGGTFLKKWNKSMKMSFQNAVDQVRYLFPHLNFDSVGLDHRKVVKEGKAMCGNVTEATILQGSNQ